jgi:hypothetical protein
MSSMFENIITTCGREVGPEEIEHVQEVVRLCTGLSRTELALTLCEHWDWVSATGAPQQRACLKLLEKLEHMGAIRLPQKDGRGRPRGRRQKRRAVPTARTAPREPIACTLAELRPVSLECVHDEEGRGLWNEYVERYHSLGSVQSIGCSLRYFVTSSKGPLGCLLMGSAARALAVRDTWIGWSHKERLQRLPWVVNNQRLLLFPWAHVRHLASHVLGQLARRIQDDWESLWRYRPVLLETFVDPAEHSGVSYRAAGWQILGETTGQGVCRPNRQYSTTPKLVFVRPLVDEFRELLCSST